jgi:hypothetical protein
MPPPHAGALAEVHRDADRAVAVMLEGIGSTLAHRDRKAVALRDIAIAAAGAGAARALERRVGEAFQLCALAAETVALRHGGAMIIA